MFHNLRDDYSLYHHRMDKFFFSLFPLFACGGAGGAAPCITLASRRRSFIRNLLLARGVGFAKYFPRLQNSRLEGSRGCPSFFFSYCWWVSWTSPSIVSFCSCLNIFLCLGALITRFFLLPDFFFYLLGSIILMMCITYLDLTQKLYNNTLITQDIL